MKVGLIAIARMENSYIKEFYWLFQTWDLDNIIIYDNNRTGEESFDTVLSDYINNNKVLIMNVRVPEEMSDGNPYNQQQQQTTLPIILILWPFDVDEIPTPSNNFDNIKTIYRYPCFSG